MNESVWKRIEAALDARVDPLGDETVVADPAGARAARRLMQRLARLDEIAPGSAPRRRRLVAAAVVVLALAATSLTLRTSTPPEHSPPVTTVSLVVERTSPPPPRGTRVVLGSRRVVAWTLEGQAP